MSHIALSRIINKNNEEEELLQLLTRKNIITTRDLLSKPKIEIMHVLDVNALIIEDLIQKVCLSIAPSPILLSNFEKLSSIPTSLEFLDISLHGGLPVGITEIVGPAGVGKTQFCHMISIVTTLPEELGGLNGSVLYFDTENTFSGNRLVEIAQSRFSDYFQNQELLNFMASKVTREMIWTTKQLSQRLESSELETYIVENNVKLIVVDSIASVMRKEFDKNTVVKRQDTLVKESSVLKYLAETFELAVVVTNQVTTTNTNATATFNFDNKLGTPQTTHITAALGTAWAHCVNTRLIFEYQTGLNRRLTIAKCPLAPVISCSYTVETHGLQVDENLPLQESTNNFWETSIATTDQQM